MRVRFPWRSLTDTARLQVERQAGESRAVSCFSPCQRLATLRRSGEEERFYEASLNGHSASTSVSRRRYLIDVQRHRRVAVAGALAPVTLIQIDPAEVIDEVSVRRRDRPVLEQHVHLRAFFQSGNAN